MLDLVLLTSCFGTTCCISVSQIYLAVKKHQQHMVLFPNGFDLMMCDLTSYRISVVPFMILFYSLCKLHLKLKKQKKKIIILCFAWPIMPVRTQGSVVWNILGYCVVLSVIFFMFCLALIHIDGNLQVHFTVFVFNRTELVLHFL